MDLKYHLVSYVGIFLLFLTPSCNSSSPEDKIDTRKITVVSNDELEEKTVSISGEVNFDVSFPESWERIIDSTIEYGAIMKCDSSFKYCPNFQFFYSPRRKKYSLKKYAFAFVNLQSKELEDSKIETVGFSDLSSDDLKLLVMEQILTLGELQLTNLVAIYESPDSKNILFLSMLGDLNDKRQTPVFKEIFPQIINSVKFPNRK